jgi:hypothetical protein
MGEQALRFFGEAGSIGGLVAQMRLASLAKLTSTEAGAVEDSPEVLRRLEEAVRRLRAQTHTRPEGQAAVGYEGTVVPMQSTNDEVRLLRRQLQTYVELMSQRSLLLGDIQGTIRRINEAASVSINVERVSVWFLDEARTKITCADLFVRSTRKHTSGNELFAKDAPHYFRALGFERTIAANDAHRDPRTSCFSASYLTPLGINSMLDVPISHGDKMVGVVCHEHVGPKRKWNIDEETFGYLMANFVALALERRGKP